jgi:hypothetical protein
MAANLITVTLSVEARRSRDVDALAYELERVFRRFTIGQSNDVLACATSKRKRGGKITMRTSYDLDHSDARSTLADINDAIENSADLIERVDTLQLTATNADGIVAFCTNDLRDRELAHELRIERARESASSSS